MYQNEKNIPIISELIYQSLSKFCKKIRIKCNFNFGFACKKRNCELFAGVVNISPYPYSTTKYCKNCKNSTLQYDEMSWLITQDIVKIMNPMVCTQRAIYYYI